MSPRSTIEKTDETERKIPFVPYVLYTRTYTSLVILNLLHLYTHSDYSSLSLRPSLFKSERLMICPSFLLAFSILVLLFSLSPSSSSSSSSFSRPSFLRERPFRRPALAGNPVVWIYRSLFQLPRDVEDVRGGDEHDAESDGGVPSPVFRVREPPAVGGPDLRGVEPTTTAAHVCVCVARRVLSSSARVVFVRITV